MSVCVTVDGISRRVASLREAHRRGDRIAASAGVDELMIETLRLISAGAADPRAMAAAALVAIDEELGDA